MKRIYISGPITKGNRSLSFFQAAEAQRRLMLAGYAVFNPMLSMLHPDGMNIDWQTWIDSDLAWVAASDLVLRLPGESAGADVETAFANERGIPVVGIDHFDCLRGLHTHPHQGSNHADDKAGEQVGVSSFLQGLASRLRAA